MILPKEYQHALRTFIPILAIVVFSGAVSADQMRASQVQGCLCNGQVGNVNCDYADIVDIADLTMLVDHLFISLSPLPSVEEANVDGDPLGIIDIGDLTALIDHLYITFPELPPCPGPFNSPPQTEIFYGPSCFVDVYINAVAPGPSLAGVPMFWRGFDRVDHPYYPPGFEFEWRLYGPYRSDSLNGAEWEEVWFEFRKDVFLRNNGELYRKGRGEGFAVCDTTWWPVGEDSLEMQIACDSVLIDTITGYNPYGRLDTLLDTDDPVFADNPLLNRIAASSSDDGHLWVTDTSDTIYNVFADAPSDTTWAARFLFWVRARDPVDSTLYDPTPALWPLTVFDPKFERDIGVLDLQLSFSVNARNKDTARVFWERSIDQWAANNGRDIDYLDSQDYYTVASPYGPDAAFKDLLSYKILVLLNDNTLPGMMISTTFARRVFAAIDVGVNVWSAQRAPVAGGEAMWPIPLVFNQLSPSLVDGYNHYFGVEEMFYSGWQWYAYRNFITGEPPLRIEDFVGMYSADGERWPDVAIDTALLHRRYQWVEQYPWVDSIAALPEVDWAAPIPGAEIMFQYQSLYPEGHFLGDTNYNLQGRPVAHRWETEYFRTVHWMCTPYAFEETNMQTVIDSVLEWLYDPTLSEPISAPRYPGMRSIESGAVGRGKKSDRSSTLQDQN